MMKPVTSLLIFSLLMLAFPSATFAMPLDLVTKNFQNIKATAVAKLPEALKSVDAAALCSAFDATKKKLSETAAAKEKNVTEYIEGLAGKEEDKRNSRDAKLEEARSEADQTRSLGYAKLMERAKNDDQKDAVKKYQNTIEESIDDRRDSVDAAIAEFRKGMDALVAKRQASMRTTRDAFTASVQAATKKLEADCAAGVTKEVLMDDFKAALKTGRDKLATDRKAAATLQAEIKALSEAKQKSIALAVTTFQAELKQAGDDLQAAFAEHQ